ncbi:MAG: Fe-S cluster assembly ATPase SufC [Candidatus Poseidoniaceae archaeon]|jgi:Fe-S cluster assembly ATP-binding protein|nr:Fe-S cluster assembly ATPase SufC [Candidatus Poseidoniaceae archaeon]
MGDEILCISNVDISVEGKPIVSNLSLTISKGEVHAIMGRNGSGKSTLVNAIMGHPSYEITAGNISYLGVDLANLEIFERARLGMFLSFQYPSVIPGVQVGTFLRKSVAAVREDPPSARDFRNELKLHMDTLGMDRSFLSRYVNDGFSGGEKKRLEILQLLLHSPKLALLDETDSGLDIDGLRAVSEGINQVIPNAGCLIITHYQRVLDHVNPDFVHVMIDGSIVKSGGPELAIEIESKGYDWLDNKSGD